MQNEQGFFPDLGKYLPGQTLSKKGFAEAIGVSQGRVSQMIKDGLPVEPNGRISLQRGKAWVDENIDPNRRRIAPASGASFSATTPRAEREIANARLASMKAEKLAGNLIDRKAALRAVESRARAERDAWIGWVNRIAPEVAAATGGDLSALTGLLDRLVRDQIAAMAALPIERLER